MPVRVRDFLIGDKKKLTVVAGPCVIEGREMLLRTADFLKQVFEKCQFNFLFKSSYDKANRSSISGFRGPGVEEGLALLEEVKRECGVPIFTDVHTSEEALLAGSVCDMIQIPAFLSRQTDLLVAAGRTKIPVNIKKGQFMAPWDIKHAIEKIRSVGNEQITLTERGISFGYNNLVVDFRSIPVMQDFGYPVIFDATHAVQLPATHGSSSGGEREFVPLLIRSALASGVDGLYVEVHPDPALARSDKETQIPLSQIETLADEWKRLFETLSEKPLCVL